MLQANLDLHYQLYLPHIIIKMRVCMYWWASLTTAYRNIWSEWPIFSKIIMCTNVLCFHKETHWLNVSFSDTENCYLCISSCKLKAWLIQSYGKYGPKSFKIALNLKLSKILHRKKDFLITFCLLFTLDPIYVAHKTIFSWKGWNNMSNVIIR